MSVFSLFFNDELLDDFTFQMNLYNTASANDKGTKPGPPVEVDELKKVFGIVLFMGIEKFPNRRLYWKPSTLSKFIADANISCKWFEQILSVLHFNDNNLQKPFGDPNFEPLFKLKPIVHLLQNIFGTIVIPETMVEISSNVTCPQKPTKWGYKLWSLAGLSGYVYNFEIVGENGAKGSPPGEPFINDIVESDYVVLRFSDNLAKESKKIFLTIILLLPSCMSVWKKKKFILFLHLE